MKKLIVLAFGIALASATASTAQAQVNRASPKVTVRSNYVYTFAYQACPKAVELEAKYHRDTLPFLDGIAKDAHMSNEETNLLVLMCFMYNNGAGLTPRI